MLNLSDCDPTAFYNCCLFIISPIYPSANVCITVITQLPISPWKQLGVSPFVRKAITSFPVADKTVCHERVKKVLLVLAGTCFRMSWLPRSATNTYKLSNKHCGFFLTYGRD